MKVVLALCILTVAGFSVKCQNFKLLDGRDNYLTEVNAQLRIPLRIKNQTEKAQTYTVKITSDELGATQKGYFCFEDQCLDVGATEFSKLVGPGESLQGLYYLLETGLVSGQQTLHFEIFSKGAAVDVLQHPVIVSIEERMTKQLMFKSKEITVHEIYPNPTSGSAFVDYRIHDERVHAKIILHNVLGSPLGNFDLPLHEQKVKIQTDELPAGVYFYTVYLDNESILTRKLIVRK